MPDSTENFAESMFALERARQAQQKHEQMHDVQLEIGMEEPIQPETIDHCWELREPCEHDMQYTGKTVHGSQQNFLGFTEDFSLDEMKCTKCPYTEWE